MIFLVSRQQQLFESEKYQMLSPEEALKMMREWNRVQFDSEENGRDAHINQMLSAQFGNDATDTRIVVDLSTINILLFKEILESKLVIMQNAKFDLQFLYNYGIVPMKIYDTMIVEQLLHLGYPTGQISYALNAIAKRRLGVDIDKTVRGEIIWRGLDESVIVYGAGDVTYLEQIMESQLADLRKQDLIRAAFIETQFVPVIAYLEWCGIYLNRKKWEAKMANDAIALEKSKKALDEFVINHPILAPKFTFVNRQGDLFSGFDSTPKCTVNWSSSHQVVKVAKLLGFDTTVQDKRTGEDKDSVLEKHLKSQKGVNDEFLKLYFDYQGFFKVVTSFGQGHLNAINPNTGRIHTVYKQLGAASGRMSCGSQQPNEDLAKLLKISPKECTYPNIQQLPADEPTRGAFTNQHPDTLICSADFSALESRLGADIYQEKSMIDEFLHGSGDMHSLCAYMVYKEIPRDTPISEIAELYPKLRKAVKPIEFSQQFGGSEFAIQGAMGCTLEEAQEFKRAYDEGFPGIAQFKAKGSQFVRTHGYVLMCQYSGHKMYWWDWEQWKERQERYSAPGFWDEYKAHHKGTGDALALEVKHHFQAASKWDRMALNGPTQGSGIVILKIAMRKFFEWILANGYFNKVKLCALVHDEAVIEFPKDIEDAPQVLKTCMEEAAALVCKSLPIPSKPETSDHWVH